MTIGNKINIALQRILPQQLLSRLMGRLASSRVRFWKNAFIRWFIKRYQVDLSIAVRQSVSDYRSFNDFFTRKLKPQHRPMAPDPRAMISPADGTLSQYGKIVDSRLIQAKGCDYSLLALLGGDAYWAEQFQGGTFATIYLSPRDYHRVHMPLAGCLLAMHHISGQLFSVNPMSSELIPNLFTRNERVLCFFDTKHGKMAVILVGAMIVGSIHLDWHGTVVRPTGKVVTCYDYSDKSLDYQRGEEMGYFQMGSTVIVLSQADKMAWHGHLSASMPLVFGQSLALPLNNEIEEAR